MVKPATIVGHLHTAMLHGHSVDLARLALASPPPTRQQWEQMQEAAAVAKLDVVGTKEFFSKEFIKNIVGEEAPPEDYYPWYPLVTWWLTLQRTKIPVSFGTQAKRPKL
mmetsp:Transcript_48635/g.95349  ORF Transcript_48635/g.95349 Transcript_48635/m.95349 type:complete len:109 (+) Transcript_48635:669-995(+)